MLEHVIHAFNAKENYLYSVKTDWRLSPGAEPALVVPKWGSSPRPVELTRASTNRLTALPFSNVTRMLMLHRTNSRSRAVLPDLYVSADNGGCVNRFTIRIVEVAEARYLCA